MYFLDGDRQYIKPKKVNGTKDEQLMDCLFQLKQINSGKRIFKLNFFVDTASDDIYIELKSVIEKNVFMELSQKIIVVLIAQPPLTCKILVEAFYYSPKLWSMELFNNGSGSSLIFKRENTRILIGNVQSNLQKDFKSDAQRVFSSMKQLFEKHQFPINSIVLQWNYLEDIVGFDGDKQKYQEFNNVRSEFYANHFVKKGYPAATGIGMNRGGIIIEFVAVTSDEVLTKPIDNPEQFAAHTYSENVLIGNDCFQKTTPKFERARYLELFNKKLIFISGTASIVGEHTVGIGNPAEQTEVTIKNIQRLYSAEVLSQISEQKLKAKFVHARVYIKNRKDFPTIKKTFNTYLGDLPVVYIMANICRESLLVEIEGKVILE